MKITNQSSRLYYIGGQAISPGKTAEVDDVWKDNKTVQASIVRGELRVADKDEAITAEPISKKEKAVK